MKIAVISDIHGNMEALKAVMTDIERLKCDKIFVLGDYAMAGPEPSAVIGYFMTKVSNPNFCMIQGNTDLMIANYSEELYTTLKEKAPVMAEALKNDVEILSNGEKNFLKELPIQHQIETDGVSFLLVHGSPRKNNEDILPDTPLSEVEKMISNVSAQVVLCGHTHIPTGFQTTRKITVVNAGSVGRPFTPEPKSCYLTITVENGQCLFEHHFIKYNNIKAAEKLAKRNFLGAQKLSNTLLNPTERHF